MSPGTDPVIGAGVGAGLPLAQRQRPRRQDLVVGVARVTLLVPASSLKDKRRVAKSVESRLRSRFNVAVAEIAHQESWSTLTLGIACISNDAGHAHAMLEKVVSAVADLRLDADLVDYDIEML